MKEVERPLLPHASSRGFLSSDDLAEFALVDRSWPAKKRHVSATLAVVLLALLLLLGLPARSQDEWLAVIRPSSAKSEEACSARAYEGGRWIRKINAPTSLQSEHDIYAALNTSGCRAQFTTGWNLGLREPRQEALDELVETMSYDWVPQTSCQLESPTMVAKLQSLVDSPLLVVGDSRSRQQFFALSCELNDHLLWKGSKPDIDDGRPALWRLDWQHLLLNPASPLMAELHLPPSFSFEEPLISFTLTYTLLSRLEIRELVGASESHLPDSIYRPEYGAWEIPASKALDAFHQRHYKTLLVSTGAHFSPFVFNVGSASPTELIAISRLVFREYLARLLAGMRDDQRVIIRAAEAGQENCSDYKVPLQEVGDQGRGRLMDYIFNFDFLQDINDAIRDEAQLVNDRRVTWLGTGRISRLRPDAHMFLDCVHYTISSGVFQAINRYLWHHLAG